MHWTCVLPLRCCSATVLCFTIKTFLQYKTRFLHLWMFHIECNHASVLWKYKTAWINNNRTIAVSSGICPVFRAIILWHLYNFISLTTIIHVQKDFELQSLAKHLCVTDKTVKDNKGLYKCCTKKKCWCVLFVLIHAQYILWNKGSLLESIFMVQIYFFMGSSIFLKWNCSSAF